MTISLEQIAEFTSQLEGSVHRLARHFEPPRFVDVNSFPEFRHAQRDDLLLSFLKCIRAVSALNASVVLLRNGFVQEVGAQCRCIDEFCEDVFFLATPLGEDGRYSVEQNRLVEEFFQEEFSEDPGPLMQSQPRNRVPRDKVRAGIARIQGMPINPSDTNQLYRVLGRTFSGYVHGAYVHIMEMYGGPTLDRCRFHTSGMSGTPRVPQFTESLANYAYRVAAAAEIVARRCEDNEVKTELEVERVRYEETTGVGAGDAEDILKRAKRRR